MPKICIIIRYMYTGNSAMPRWMDFSKKQHLGSVDWRLAKDWRILQWGNIFSIPPEELKKYNWGEIGYGLTIEFPIIKSEYDNAIGGQNNKVYYTVILDWEYLLERQANLFGSLSWSKAEITNFLTEQLDWLDRRSQELEKVQKEKALIEAAQEISKATGQPIEYWLEKINGLENVAKSTPAVKESSEGEKIYPLGKIDKMGNEFFILEATEEDTETQSVTYKNKWKIGTTEKYQTKIGSLDLKDCIGYTYHFEADLETTPPKSRNAKGWVKEIFSN